MKRTKSALTFFLATMLTVVALLTTGCAATTNHMTTVRQEPYPEPEEACVTFYRVSSRAKEVSVPIVAMNSNGEIFYVGVLVKNSRIICNLAPGKYRFTTCVEQKSVVVEAEIEAGKFYYVEAMPQKRGWAKTTFSLEPISPRFLELNRRLKRAIVSCDILVPNSRGRRWFEDNYELAQRNFEASGDTSTLKASYGLDDPVM